MGLSAIPFSLFRLAFGVLMIPQVLHLLPFIHDLEHSTFVFHYPGLTFIEAYSHELIDFLGGLAIGSAVFLALGILPRIAAFLFLLSFGYLFLIDQSFYNNHYYLWCLIAFLFALLPTQRAVGIRDVFRGNYSKQIPIHTYIAMGLLVSIVYFFGGVAKLSTDWLQGYPMILMTKEKGIAYPEFWGLFLSYSGLVFDLLIGFALWFKPKSWHVWLPYLLFHLSNYILFNIGEFPLVMLAAWLLFLPLSQIDKRTLRDELRQLLLPKSFYSGILIVFFVLQLLLPFRYLLVAPNVSWHRQGYSFSWRMMLNYYELKHFQFLVKIEDKEVQYQVDFKKLLTYRQFYHVYHEPYMIWQLAQKLRADAESKYNSSHVEVYCSAVIRLNNRNEKMLIDPSVELSRMDYTFFGENEFINY